MLLEEFCGLFRHTENICSRCTHYQFCCRCFNFGEYFEHVVSVELAGSDQSQDVYGSEHDLTQVPSSETKYLRAVAFDCGQMAEKRTGIRREFSQ